MNIGSTSSLITAETVDLSNCEREAIQIPGTIQSHGAMLVCAGADWRIDHASENTGDVLGVTPAEIIGQKLASVIGTDHVNSLKSALEASLGLMRARIFRLELPNGHEFHIHVTGRSGLNIIEFERVTGHDVSVSPLGLVEALLSRMQSANTVEKHCNFAADGVRRLIGFDRVMVYKFLHDGSGEVICERKRSDLSPFLGLRYPASDIPSQARALYLKSWIRLIADVASKPVPIIPERDPSGQPVDLSLAALRSVSPIHIEYLQNMGVAASMSISIIVGGKLWGLIACHHYTPKIVAADIRAAAELFGQIFSLQIEALEPNDRGDSVRAARSNIDALLANFPNSGSLLDNLSQRLPTLRAIVPCDGIGIWVDGVWVHQGSAPPAREIPGIARLLMDAGSGEMFTTHELSNRVPSSAAYMADASGLLAIPLSRSSRDFLMYFRKEVVHTVNWGGDPNKPVTVGPRGDRLTPRKSFAVWSQTVRGQSTPWSQGDRLAGEALRISLLEVVLRLNEVATRERTLAAERQSLLISELNHRVKNVLALVSSLVSRGRNEGQTLMSFVHGLQGRIKALAFAHDQATKSGAGTLAGLFEAETLPYRQKSVGSIELSGPDVGLDAQAFSVFALVVHEMVTNAAKYGALSVPNARLSISWRLDPAGDCIVEWQENGGPAVQASRASGFGATLIERQIPHELNGRADVRYELTGVSARFLIPARHVVEAADVEAFKAIVRPMGAESTKPLNGLRIMLVEDSLLIALDAEHMLQDAGALSVEVCNNAEAALGHVSTAGCSVAVLDINLGRGTSISVADELTRRNIPFVFASGYTDVSTIPERFRHISIVAKPYTVAALSAAIERETKSGSS